MVISEGEEKTEEEGGRGEKRKGRGQEEPRDEETTRKTNKENGEDGGETIKIERANRL